MSSELVTSGPEVRFIPVGLIDASPFNPRKDWNEDDQADMDASVGQLGVIQPILLRPGADGRFELIAGERRFRSCERTGMETVPAIVRELDDREAANIQATENELRKDLNAIERGEMYRRLIDVGHDVASIAELLHRTTGQIDASLKLGRLPERWTDRVRSGELPAAYAEYLTPFCEHPEILSAMDATFKASWPMPLASWRARLTGYVLQISRSLDPDAADGPRFKPTRRQKKDLDVVTVRRPDGRTEDRAMNVELWDRLQEAEEHQLRIATPPADDAGDGYDADRPDELPQGAEPPARGHAAFARSIAPETPPGPDAVDAAARDFATTWLHSLIRSHLDGLGAAELWRAAEALGLEPADSWRLDREFLESLPGDALRALASELRVDVSGAKNDGEAAAVISHACRRTMPAAVRAAVGLADGEDAE